MFAVLPKSLQDQVIHYMQTDNFRAAKELHDDYFNSQDAGSSKINDELEESAA